MKMRKESGGYIKDNPEEFEFMSEENAIIQAISDLEIELYKDYTESDTYTDDIRWSEYEDEERSVEEILNR